MAEEIPEVRRRPTREELGLLIALAGFLFGAWLRLLPAVWAGAPVNDGGLFLQTIETIRESGLNTRLIQYNGLQIPFAYPPLGFYLAVAWSEVANANIFEILRWLPAVIAIATLPGFFLLAREITGSTFTAAIGLLCYAFTARSFAWLIMGGGLTRSLGHLFLLLATYSLYRLFTQPGRRELAAAIVCSSLVVLSHPEAAVHAVGAGVLLWICYGGARALRDVAILAIGCCVLTAFWWLPVLTHFGPQPLLSAAQTGLHSPTALLIPFVTAWTGEPLMTLTAAFALLGIASEMGNKRLFLPAWFLAAFVIEPRSAATAAMIPASMLAGLALTQLVEQAPSATGETAHEPTARYVFPGLLLFVALYMFGGGVYMAGQTARKSLTAPERAAFAWVAEKTPLESRFVILTGNLDLFSDRTQEWFPVLAKRISTTTIQGREWIEGADFQSEVAELQKLQGCIGLVRPLACALPQLESMQIEFDYVYVARVVPGGVQAQGAGLIAALEESASFKKVYESNDVIIFARLGD